MHAIFPAHDFIAQITWTSTNNEKAYYVNQKFFESRLVTNSSKLILYRTVIRPICDLRLRNMATERNCNSEIAGNLEENFKKNIWAYERKSNMAD